jgi:ABC-2 type transport system ATP-binding protein
MLELINISKSFDFVHALKDLTFSVNAGEIVGLVGSNGSGKTTALRLITKFLIPDIGNILINREDISNIPAEQFKISYIPDEPVYYEFMTFSEHLQFVQSMYPKGEYSIEKVIELFSLGDDIKKMPHVLSKGNKQKLMICMAIIRNYDYLIADEPFTGLDPRQLNILKQLFMELRARKKGVLISTHLLDVIELFCDRYIMIDGGAVIASGTKEEIAQFGGLECSRTIEQMYISLTKSS